MGIDSSAVVSPQLLAHGVVRLRVIDVSIMPTGSSGNTSALMDHDRRKRQGADLICATAPQPLVA